MAVAMKSYFVAFVKNPLGNIRIVLDPVAAQQEGGLCAPVVKTVQQCPGVFSGGSVVKSQRHIFAAVICPDGKHQKRDG